LPVRSNPSNKINAPRGTTVAVGGGDDVAAVVALAEVDVLLASVADVDVDVVDIEQWDDNGNDDNDDILHLSTRNGRDNSGKDDGNERTLH
jgi:hypothetical protein